MDFYDERKAILIEDGNVSEEDADSLSLIATLDTFPSIMLLHKINKSFSQLEFIL